MTFVPLRYCSWAMAWPKRYMAVVFQDMTLVRADGQQVTAETPSATPCGPSSRLMGGMPTRVLLGTLPT
jgi:hypothetical protein